MLLVVVQIAQIKSYALTSTQNEAHIYVGTVIGAITIEIQLPRVGEALPLPSVQYWNVLYSIYVVKKSKEYCTVQWEKVGTSTWP